jgi:hypothetical protein
MADDPTRRDRSFARLAPLLSLSCLLWVGCSGGDTPPAEDEAPAAAADAAANAAASAPANAGAQKADVHGADATAKSDKKAEALPPGEAPFDTTYLDADSELFVYARVAEILDSALVQTLTGGNLGPLNQVKNEIGIDPREIDSVTVGIVDVAGLSQKSAEAMQQFNPMTGMGAPPSGTGLGSGTWQVPAVLPGQYGGGQSGPGSTAAPNPAMSMHNADPAASSAGSSSMHGAPPAGMAAATHAGSAQASSGAQSSGGSASAAAGGDSDREVMVAVIRTKSPIDVDRLEANTERLPHGDKAYYRTRQTGAEDAACVFLAEATTLVVADEITIKQVIDEGQEKSRPSADLGFVKTLPHLLIAVAPRTGETLLKDLGGPQKPSGRASGSSSGSSSGYEPPEDGTGHDADMAVDDTAVYEDPASAGYDEQFSGGGGGPQQAMPQIKPDQKLFEDHTQAVALLVDLSQGIDLSIAMRSDSADSAGKLQAELDRNLTQVREQFEAARAMLPGVIQQLAQPLVDSLAVQTDEAVVRVSTRLPEEKQSMLAMLPMAVMGMMMSGGMQMDAEFESMTSRRELAQTVIDEGQPADNADELPEGLQVKALARWGESPYGDQAPPPLEIGIVALEGPAAQAIALGKMELTEARLDGDRQLKWLGTSTDAMDGNALTAFLPIERDGMFSEHPDNGVITGYLLAPPAGSAGALQSVAGQFVLQIAGRTEDVLLTNLSQLRGPIDDSRLASARMNVDVSRAAQGQVEISWNDSPLIGTVELVSADGRPVQNAGTGTFRVGGRKTMTVSLTAPPPQDLALRVVTRSDLQEVAVPFRFENLQLPEAPQLSEQQQALLVWTRAESPKDQPDLIIEAQARWRDPEPVVAVPMTPMNGRFGTPGSGYPGSGSGGAGYSGEAMDPSMDMEMDTYTPPDDGTLSEGYPGSAGGSGAGGATRPPASDEPLRIVVDLIGPLAQAAEAVGEVAVTSVKSDIDTSLTFEGARVADREGDPLEGFVDVTSQTAGISETPPGALRVILNLTPPNQSIGGISQLNGNLKLRTVRERTETILSDLQSRVGPPEGDAAMAQKMVTDRELIKFGLKPAVAIGANQVMMRLVEGKDDRISAVSLLDHNGLPLTGVNASVREGSGNARGRKIYAFQFPGGVPQKIGMKIAVNMGVRDISIPIRLRDMPLPPMPQEAG